MNKQTQNELINIVKRNYEEIADHYSETRKKKIWPELEKLSEEVKDGDKILDVGCGSGKLLQVLIGKKIVYLGVDSSEKMLENAKKQYPGYRFEMGDIQNLGKINEHNFDYVYCIAVLHHIPGRDLRVDALKQLKNKINDNGKIIISVWNMWSQEWKTRVKKDFRKMILKFLLLKIIGKNKMEFGDILLNWKNPRGEKVSQRYYHSFTKCEFKKISKKAGLKIERIFKDKYNYYVIIKK